MSTAQLDKITRIKTALRTHVEETEKATAGPWGVSLIMGDSRVVQQDGYGTTLRLVTVIPLENNWSNEDANARFIAHARTMSPLACWGLLVAIEGLEYTLGMAEAGHFTLADGGELYNTFARILDLFPENL